MIVHQSGLTNAGYKSDNVFQGWRKDLDFTTADNKIDLVVNDCALIWTYQCWLQD